MSGYVDAGYVIAIGTLATYGSALIARERRVRGQGRRPTPAPSEDATSRLLAMTEPVVDLGDPSSSR